MRQMAGDRRLDRECRALNLVHGVELLSRAGLPKVKYQRSLPVVVVSRCGRNDNLGTEIEHGDRDSS